MANYKLRYLIDADNKDAKQKVRELDGMFTRMGVDAGSSLRKLAGPAVIASGAIAAIGAAAVAATKGLFDLTREAAAYGSEISDITDKTGLGAKTITTLKLAADLGGSSIEAMTSGLSRFAKKVGDAADGSKEAAADIAALGISPKEALEDLDGALDKVFTRILEIPPGAGRSAMAMKAFGKSGADLIPVIKTFNGDLEAFKKHAEELGVTLTDDTARAMDKFDDTMKQVGLQMKGVKSTIAESFLPVFQDMATATSDWLKTNKDEIRVWGQASADVLTGLIEYWRDLKRAADDYHASEYFKQARDAFFGFGGFGVPLTMLAGRGRDARNRFPDPTAEQLALMPAGSGIAGRRFGDQEEAEAKAAAEKLRKEREAAAKRELSAQIALHANQIAAVERMYSDLFAGLTERFKQTGDPAEYEAEFQRLRAWYGGTIGELAGAWDALVQKQTLAEKEGAYERTVVWQQTQDRLQQLGQKTLEFEDAKNKAIAEMDKRAAEERLRAAQTVLQRQMSEFAAGQATIRARIGLDVARGALTEGEGIRGRQAADMRTLEFRKTVLTRELELVKGNADEEARIKHELGLLKQEIDRTAFEHQREGWEATLRVMKETEQENKKLAEEAAKAWEKALMAVQATAAGTLLGGISGGLGVNLVSIFDPDQVGVMRSQADRIKEIYADIATFAGNSIGSMVDGLWQMGAAWLATGQFSAQAALQMLSAAAMNIAGQSLFKAIFEYAEAAAAAARYDFYAAGMHTTAAKTYLKTAAIAGGFGVGFGVGARAAGGGGAGEGSASGTGFRGRDVPPDPLSRSSDDAFISGRRMDPATAALARAVEKLDQKISGMSAGDVLVAGSRQRRGFIAARVAADIKADATAGVRLGRSLQLR